LCDPARQIAHSIEQTPPILPRLLLSLAFVVFSPVIPRVVADLRYKVRAMNEICTLRVLTWRCVQTCSGGKEIIPICPTHPGSKTRWGFFGTGVIVTCEVGNHLVKMRCDAREFKEEREEASRRFKSADN
jgi:hypothetical protein